MKYCDNLIFEKALRCPRVFFSRGISKRCSKVSLIEKRRLLLLTPRTSCWPCLNVILSFTFRVLSLSCSALQTVAAFPFHLPLVVVGGGRHEWRHRLTIDCCSVRLNVVAALGSYPLRIPALNAFISVKDCRMYSIAANVIGLRSRILPLSWLELGSVAGVSAPRLEGQWIHLGSDGRHIAYTQALLQLSMLFSVSIEVVGLRTRVLCMAHYACGWVLDDGEVASTMI